MTLLVTAIILTIILSSNNRFISITQNCSKPFTKELWEPCNCANECKIALVCAHINNTKKCKNIMSDYIREKFYEQIQDKKKIVLKAPK